MTLRIIVACALIALCSACAPEKSAAPTAECPAPNSGDPASALANSPDYSVTVIKPADVGPGIADAHLGQFCESSAAEISPKNAVIVGGPNGEHSYVVLRVLAGTVKSDADAFVDEFLTRLGLGARNGTVKLDGRVVQHFVTPTGDGYAYAEGPNVVIGYITPISELNVRDLATTQEPAKDAFTRIIAAATGAPVPAEKRTNVNTGFDTDPLGRGRFTTPDDPGWIYFKTASGRGCGIGPRGTIAGCDAVPYDAPDDANQIIVDNTAAARYNHSGTTTFTRDVDTLLPGHRIENGSAVCGIGYQGAVSCRIGEHKFVVSGTYAVLE